MQRKPHLFTILVLAGAALGLLFASYSTYDFARHLDRQVHSVNCSFVPGLDDGDKGVTGCHVTMMSHYSSVFREVVWGGVPIALPAMSVFAFLLLFGIELCVTRRQEDHRATAFLALAALLPAAASLVMAIVSFTKLDAACKLCIGIYFSSALVLLGALCLWRRSEQFRRTSDIERMTRGVAPRDDADPAWTSSGRATDPMAATAMAPPEPRVRERPPVTWGYLAAAFMLGVVLVVVPAFAYVTMAPDHSVFLGQCGDLVAEKDDYGVMAPIDRHPGGVQAIEVLDPLCPACRAFERRLDASGLDTELDRVAVMFPLDDECNWMSDKKHPGACAISEAVLCAGERASEVVTWAFEEQEAIVAAAATSGDGARALARERFPDLGKCIGSASVKSKLNKSLRWVVRNQLPVLTPQMYVGGVKMCDEDTDLGMEFALSRMIERARDGTLQKRGKP